MSQQSLRGLDPGPRRPDDTSGIGGFEGTFWEGVGVVSERRFWHKMTYGCDSGDPSHELVFVLEDGCEGPRDESIPTVIQSGPFKGRESEMLMTASGRVVLPVPYVAGRCPTCARAGGCRPSMMAGRFTIDSGSAPHCGDHRDGRLVLCSISHTRWNEDQDLVPMAVSDGPPESPAFLYPSPEEQESMAGSHGQVCGIPVYEGRR